MYNHNDGKQPFLIGALFDYEAAQKYLGNVSRSTIKALAAQGEIEKIPIAERRAGFTKDSLDDYIERQRQRRAASVGSHENREGLREKRRDQLEVTK